MKRSTLVIALAVIFLVVVGSAVWLSLSKPSNTPSADNTSQTSTNTTDFTNKTSVEVSMRDLSYTPAHIKIKIGTKVTWTNNDTVGHNVVADSPSSSGGLPVTSPLFGKGGTFSHTFDAVGTFAYHCTPHPFMKGTVEVVQ